MGKCCQRRKERRRKGGISSLCKRCLKIQASSRAYTLGPAGARTGVYAQQVSLDSGPVAQGTTPIPVPYSHLLIYILKGFSAENANTYKYWLRMS